MQPSQAARKWGRKKILFRLISVLMISTNRKSDIQRDT